MKRDAPFGKVSNDFIEARSINECIDSKLSRNEPPHATRPINKTIFLGLLRELTQVEVIRHRSQFMHRIYALHTYSTDLPQFDAFSIDLHHPAFYCMLAVKSSIMPFKNGLTKDFLGAASVQI